MRGYYKVDNELHNRPCVRAAKHDPMTRQCASLWAAILSLAKEANNGGRLEHDGGPFTLEEMAEHCGIVVPEECVTRDVTDRHAASRVTSRSVTLACVTLFVERWGWAEWDGDVLVVKSWGAWYGEDEAKLAQKREKDRERAARYRAAHRLERHANVTRTSRVTSRYENVTSRPGSGSGSGSDDIEQASAAADVPSPSEPPAPKPKRETEPDRPAFVPEDVWTGFLAHRRRIKLPLVGRAGVLLVGRLNRWHAAGHDCGALLDEATERGWKSPVDPAKRYGSANNNPAQGSLLDSPAPRVPVYDRSKDEVLNRPRAPMPAETKALLDQIGRGGAA